MTLKYLANSGINKVALSLCSFVFVIVFFSCGKDDNNNGPEVNNSLTLFKLDNKDNDQDLLATDTVYSSSGVQGKYIPVSGATGAQNGLKSITIQLFTIGDELLTTLEITDFFKPYYHLFNSQLNIPNNHKGEAYKIKVTVLDNSGAEIGVKTFFGLDVITCDPIAPCVVANQITVLVETPAGTPPTDDIYIFGGFNGWNRGDAAYKLHKNPDVNNCYCITLPYPPGYGGWELGELFVSRGTYDTDATTIPDNNPFIQNYSTTDLGPLWKVKVPRWRVQ